MMASPLSALSSSRSPVRDVRPPVNPLELLRPQLTYRDTQAIRTIAVDPSGSGMFALGTNSKKLAIGDLKDQPSVSESGGGDLQFLSVLEKHHMGSVYCAAWSGVPPGSGALIASGSNSKVVKVYGVDSGVTSGLRGHSGTVRDVDFGRNSGLLYSGGAGGCEVLVWDVGAEVAVQTLSAHSGHVYSVTTGLFGPSGSELAFSGSLDGTVCVWDVRSNTQSGPAAVLAMGSPVYSVGVEPSVSRVAVGLESGVVSMLDTRKLTGGTPIVSAQLHSQAIKSISIRPTSGEVLTGSYDGTIGIASSDALARVARFDDVHVNKVISVSWFSAGGVGEGFVSSSADKTARVWM